MAPSARRASGRSGRWRTPAGRCATSDSRPGRHPRRPRGRHLFASTAPVSGIVARGGGGRRLRLSPPSPDPPPCLRGTSLLETAYRERSIGVVSEARGRRLPAVLAARVVAFSLLDP